MAEQMTKIDVDVDSRALLKQLAAENHVSMLQMFRTVIRDAWTNRPRGRMPGGEKHEHSR